MLSARALLFAGLVTLIGVIATWLQTPALEFFWRVAIAATIIAAVFDGVLAAHVRLRGHIVGSAPLPLGREVPLRIDVAIEPTRPMLLAIRTALSPDLRMVDAVRTFEHFGARPLSLTLDVRAVALGEWSDLSLPARVLGPLGLTWCRCPIPLDRALRVAPDPATRAFQQQCTIEAGARNSGDIGFGVEFQQLRPYRPGDPRRSIDWKASARSGSLITRDLMVEHRQEVMLFIDAGRGSRTEIDSLSKLGHFVNLASQLIQLAARADDQVGLIAFAGQPLVICPPLRAATAAPRLQRELGRLTSHVVESNPLLAMLRLQSVVRQRTLIVLMMDLDDPAAATQLTAALRLIMRRHLPLVVDFESAAVAALETAAPADWIDPYVALAAQEFRHAQRANALRLARLGCRVVLTRPATAKLDLARAYQAIRTERLL